MTTEPQTIRRSDLLFLFNNFNIFLLNSNSFMRVRVQEKYFFEFKFGKMIEFEFKFAALRRTAPTSVRVIGLCFYVVAAAKPKHIEPT